MTPNLNQLLTALSEAAEKATPKWTDHRSGQGIWLEYEIVQPGGGILFRSTSYSNMANDAAYIASVSPDNVTRLLDAIDAAEKALEQVQRITITDGCEECSSVWQREYGLKVVDDALAKLRQG